MKLVFPGLLLAGLISLSACQQATDSNTDADSADNTAPQVDGDELQLEDENDSLSYALGHSLGQQMQADGMDVDLQRFALGFRHGMKQEAALMTPTEVQQRLNAFRQQRRDEQQAQFEKVSAENAEAGAAWLADNGKKDGVVTTESGLQYKVVTAGTGKKPAAEDTVSVHYRGTLLDGTEFDSSYARGEPAEFPVNRVIPGWTEALQLMPVGSKWELYIPSDLAYGKAGTGRDIGPNATLLFEVELLDIK